MDSPAPFHPKKEMAALRHERRNQSMKRLPPNTTISRRPLCHPAIASPHTGSHVQKVVYVSQRTPVMSAVKRVKKLLKHIEKRAIQSVESRGIVDDQLMTNLADVSDKLARSSEEILVKASGRAMEQALRVGEWFRSKESDYMCKVEVRTGSVAAVDDIVPQVDMEAAEMDLQEQSPPDPEHTELDTTLEGGDTTLELLGDRSKINKEPNPSQKKEVVDKSLSDAEGPLKSGKRRRRKRKRETYDVDEVPEARIRWIKTIEVAISLKA